MHPEFGQRRIILLHAWMKFLPFSADRELIRWKQSELALVTTPAPDGSGSVGYALWAQRTQQHWGLLEHVQHSAKRYKIDKLLIEAKASGISAAQEMRNRFGRQDFSVMLCPVKGDKVARAYAVQPILSNGCAPNRDWADLTINQCSMFPKGKHDDIVDSMTQALKYLRDSGLASNDDEVKAEENEAMSLSAQRFKRRSSLYPC
jgi:predicted phage terminase large subunit-like protein